MYAASQKMTKNNVLTPLYQKQQRTSLLISDQQFSLRRTQNPTSFRNCKIVNIILVSATESPLLRIAIHMTGLFL